MEIDSINGQIVQLPPAPHVQQPQQRAEASSSAASSSSAAGPSSSSSHTNNDVIVLGDEDDEVIDLTQSSNEGANAFRAIDVDAFRPVSAYSSWREPGPQIISDDDDEFSAEYQDSDDEMEAILRRSLGAQLFGVNSLPVTNRLFANFKPPVSSGNAANFTSSGAYRPLDPTLPSMRTMSAAETERQLRNLLQNINDDDNHSPDSRTGTPEGLAVTLLEHQKIGLNWLVKMETSCKGGLLCDDMGLGKVKHCLYIYMYIWKDMFICPDRLSKPWPSSWPDPVRTHLRSTR